MKIKTPLANILSDSLFLFLFNNTTCFVGFPFFFKKKIEIRNNNATQPKAATENSTKKDENGKKN